MKTIRYTYWKDENFYLGYLNDYPDYHSQGLSKEELIDNLKELLKDLESDDIPYILVRPEGKTKPSTDLNLSDGRCPLPHPSMS